MRKFIFSASLFGLLWALAFPLISAAQTPRTGRGSRALITDRINEAKLHRLAGNTRPEASAQNDRGQLADDAPVEHMLLQLRRPPEQEAAARQYTEELHDPKSPNFHKWLSASEYGQKYGPAQQDVESVSNWLQSHNFAVNSIYPSGLVIDFSGTAKQVREAFRTDLHYFDVNGERHIANTTDPEIPAALAPAVAGVISMNDFKPHAMKTDRSKYTFSSSTKTYHALVPGDLAAIYNLNPLFDSGYTGRDQTIVVIEDTNLYSAEDWTAFRNAFGLDKYTAGSLTTIHPAPARGVNNCSDPGVLAGDDGEAILDAEWASAAAPDAAIQVASCGNTRSTFGGLIALQNLVNSDHPPSIVSISYGECEARNGAAANSAFNALFQQAVAEGVSIFVSAGDEGAAACDAGAGAATHGIGVSGWASTPYNVAVGGTDFADTFSSSTKAYWNATNSSTYTSAVSYVPEIPWNDSCASSLLASYEGFTSSVGTDGFCASAAGKRSYLGVVAGSGGPSGCATGSPSKTGVVSGTCRGYDKPSWQSGLAGIPDDGVRDLPDVSLFAGTGVWGHYFVYCYSNRRSGGAACTGDPSGWSGAGGTSFSSPILAGIQALINQKVGGPQGNPNYVYYKLAVKAGATCDSSIGETGTCVFHNVTQGDISVNCGGSENCYGATLDTAKRSSPLGTNGALSISSDSLDPAFRTGAGWNFATGIGTINAYNLVNSWTSIQ
jgi:subtilase family serine protease